MAVQGKKLVLWMCASVVATLILVDGLLRVIGLQLMAAQFARFGYGVGAMKAFGAAELLAGILLLVPAARLAGAALGLLLMSLAAFAYVSTGVGFPQPPRSSRFFCWRWFGCTSSSVCHPHRNLEARRALTSKCSSIRSSRADEAVAAGPLAAHC
ncbi:MAG: hypothetical protein R2724_29950 [Bryobacterales bacterium]